MLKANSTYIRKALTLSVAYMETINANNPLSAPIQTITIMLWCNKHCSNNKTITNQREECPGDCLWELVDKVAVCLASPKVYQGEIVKIALIIDCDSLSYKFNGEMKSIFSLC